MSISCRMHPRSAISAAEGSFNVYNSQSSIIQFDLLRSPPSFLYGDLRSTMEFSKLIPADEVSRHNTPSDLWIVVEDAVWDVSSFAPEHPGGVARKSWRSTPV